ncbi:MAG TPA: ice-binding family protein [Polyangiaceae bacterium]|nr:ice-binding family protein [Polyangiaceae bacterium]
MTHGGAGGAGVTAAGGVLNRSSGGASGRGGSNSGGVSSGGVSSGGVSSGGVSSGGVSSGGGGVSGKGGVSSGGSLNHAGSGNEAGSANDAGDTGVYEGPTVGTAKTFAVLAYSAVTAANISKVTGEIGVSAGAVSTITGFDAPADIKYGIDSLAPNSHRTMLAQQDVTKLVGNIDPRACDADYTNVVGGLTGDITLYPGVTCMNSFSADVLLNGHVTLDARGDSNAFFIIRGKLTLTVADAAQVVLANSAEACGVFWRFSKQVTIGKTVKFYGTVIAGSAITMNTGSTLLGRALAQTANVSLDANSITIPTDGLVGAPGVCTHVQ